MSDDICPICLDLIKTSTARLHPCNHTFHVDCIRTWHIYASDLNCPTCRIETEKLLYYMNPELHTPTVKITLKTGFNYNQIQEYSDLLRQEITQLNRQFHDSNEFQALLNEESETEEDFVEYFQNADEIEENIESQSQFDTENGSDYEETFNLIQIDSITNNLSRTLNISTPGHIEGNQPNVNIINNTRSHNVFAGRDPTRVPECHLCDNTSENIDAYCPDCQYFYHNCCLRVLSLEAEVTSTSKNCVQCSKEVSNFSMPSDSTIYHACVRDRNSALTQQLYNTIKEDALENLRIAKQNIQSHVRNMLHKLNKDSSKCSKKIDINAFTEINRKVSRELYKKSEFEYKSDEINYDEEANKLILLELKRLGYII